jgi:hypothetical protein
VALTASAPAIGSTFGRALARALAVLGVVLIAMAWPGLNLADTHAYWAVPLGNLYGAGQAGGADAYLYAPPFEQVLAPLKALPWPVFAGLWLLVMALCLVGLVGPWAVLVAFIPPVLIELQAGNIHTLLALAIALGLRRPATWSFVLLTKPTLGVGLLWFVVRREWRPLGLALLATAAISAVSFMLAPGAWIDWLAVLAANAGTGISPDYSGVIHVPLLVRLPLAAAIVIWGAWRDRPWTVAVATSLALPILWVNGLTVLLAIPLLEGWRPPQDAVARIRASLRGGGNPGSGGDRHELPVREEPDTSSQDEGRRIQHGDHQQEGLEAGE